MPEWVEALNAASAGWPRLAGAVLAQSALVAAVVALACLVLRRAAPAVRYWLWQAVALKLVLMPFWTVAVPLPPWPDPDERPAPAVVTATPRPQNDGPSPPAVPLSAEVTPATTPPAAPAWDWLGSVSWPAWLLLAWLLGIAVQACGLLWQRQRLTRLLREAVLADGSISATVAELSARLGLRRPPQVVLLDGSGSPFVCGAGWPVLVLPRGTLAVLEPAQLQQVLLHELAHVRRRDLLWGWLPEVARAVWWFNPVAWWVAAQVRLERELACDQLALAHGGASAADYAETLVRVVSPGAAP
jgi:beta-lactamase regulating signal transducer with metallopeptidase domain